MKKLFHRVWPAVLLSAALAALCSCSWGGREEAERAPTCIVIYERSVPDRSGWSFLPEELEDLLPGREGRQPSRVIVVYE